jgi:quercetin dioxygenase-like cupin family protein
MNEVAMPHVRWQSWLIGCIFGWVAAYAHAQSYYPVQQLLATGKTVVGEDIRYPSGRPRITVAIVTVQPGAPAAFHRHPVPLVAYILEGELTVDYGALGIKSFKQGDALVEAMDVPHRGINRSSNIVRLLAVYVGAEGTPDVAIDK